MMYKLIIIINVDSFYHVGFIDLYIFLIYIILIVFNYGKRGFTRLANFGSIVF